MAESAFDINLFGQWLEREHPAVMPGYRAAIAEAQASERERCAKVADAYIAFCDRENAAASYKREAARLIASRIRALSPTPNQEKPE